VRAFFSHPVFAALVLVTIVQVLAALMTDAGVRRGVRSRRPSAAGDSAFYHHPG